ncbi:class I SAM-dependent methyltransferase [Mangrovihabitans endophyticus]|uniref:Methyltransferase domain-containing protein n=1 Tax=Mangrovihabitans endophyticus TaxID=1751298 RepID=A0A8J3BYP3_9ACTN|nr:class I SAM-dependent methyltransferase [Mangrovihabitans endophyticus]GGK93204.1 hypothetical protein GCM10012284_28970 [Mangrovihabitans endophyticus]
MRYDDLLPALRASYDAEAATRDSRPKQQFKLDERAAFLDRLQVTQARTLLDLGAGTGQDSAYFQDAGLSVVAVDLSPEMTARCEAKGITAYVRDFLHLGFQPSSFDAAYAMNSFLHVPDADLAEALTAVRTVVRPGGLFFLGLWGGSDSSGVKEADNLTPKRFFAHRQDTTLLTAVAPHFDVVDFHTVEDNGWHFQSLTLAKPPE